MLNHMIGGIFLSITDFMFPLEHFLPDNNKISWLQPGTLNGSIISFLEHSDSFLLASSAGLYAQSNLF